MSSWSLLHAAAGYVYDAASGALSLAPRVNADDFRAFFVSAQGWGSLRMKREGEQCVAEVALAWGILGVRQITLAASDPARAAKSVSVEGGSAVDVAQGSDEIIIAFETGRQLTAGDMLRLRYRA